MPINQALWSVGELPVALPAATLPSEQLLERMIVKSPEIISSDIMIIGQQENTGLGGRIDLLAVYPDGSLALIEIKRDRTPREVVAQALDYASWVEQLTSNKLVQMYERYSNGSSLNADFEKRFGRELDEETLNHFHQIIIVASELDLATERIINYLNVRDIAINVVFFNVYQLDNQQILSRVWLIDPAETQTNTSGAATQRGEKEPWNGEYYVSFGSDNHRIWEDARNYGYISAGGGAWYSRTLNQLKPGDRIWVNDPSFGYLGVGIILEPAVPVTEFVIKTPSGDIPALEVLQTAEELKKYTHDANAIEYCVRVQWLDTAPTQNAVKEAGFFGNQNTVCRPTSPKWRHTVERLKTYFTKWEG